MRTGVFRGILALFLLLAAGTAQAQGRDGASLDRILPQIRAQHPGKFYDAEGPWRGPDGQLRYRLKWMTPDGRIVWFDADARTGRVLSRDSEMRERRRFEGDDRFFRDERRWNRGHRWEEGNRGNGWPREHRGNGPRRGR